MPRITERELPQQKRGGTASSGDAELQGFNQKHRERLTLTGDILSGQTVFTTDV